MTKYKCWNCHKTPGIWLHILDAIKRNEKPWNKKNPFKGWHYLRAVAQDLLYINPERYIPPCATDNISVICPDCFALIKLERTQIEAERQKKSDEAWKKWKDEEPIRKQEEELRRQIEKQVAEKKLLEWISKQEIQIFLRDGPPQHRIESKVFKWLKTHEGQTVKIKKENTSSYNRRVYNQELSVKGKSSLSDEIFIERTDIIPAPIIARAGKFELWYPNIGISLTYNGNYGDNWFNDFQIIDNTLICEYGEKVGSHEGEEDPIRYKLTIVANS